MSGFLSKFDGTVVIDAETGDEVVDNGLDERPTWWVELKKTLSSGEFERAQAFLIGDMGVESRAGDAEEDAMVRQKTDVVGYQRELALAGVISWNLTDHMGDPMPLSNREDKLRSLSKLPPFLYTAIHSTVARHNGPRSSGEQTQFPARRDGSTEVGRDSRGPAELSEVH